jgi:hypothetical protein
VKFNMINFAITHNADERKVGYAVGLFCGVMYVFMCVNRLFIGVNRLFCGVMYVYLRLYSPMNTFLKASFKLLLLTYMNSGTAEGGKMQLVYQ